MLRFTGLDRAGVVTEPLYRDRIAAPLDMEKDPMFLSELFYTPTREVAPFRVVANDYGLSVDRLTYFGCMFFARLRGTAGIRLARHKVPGDSRANETAGAPITAARRGTGAVIQMLCVEDATVEGDERGTTHVLIKDDTNFEFLRTALLVEFGAQNMPVTLKITETKGQGEKEQIYTVSSEITLEAVLHRMRSADAGSFFGALEKRDTTARRRVLRVGEASLTSKTGRVRRGAEELARRLKIASSTAWTDECDELMQAAPCPVCGEDVKLGNLSQPFNLFKHLKNVHKDLLAGKIYALRLEKANDARVDLDARGHARRAAGPSAAISSRGRRTVPSYELRGIDPPMPAREVQRLYAASPNDLSIALKSREFVSDVCEYVVSDVRDTFSLNVATEYVARKLNGEGVAAKVGNIGQQIESCNHCIRKGTVCTHSGGPASRATSARSALVADVEHERIIVIDHAESVGKKHTVEALDLGSSKIRAEGLDVFSMGTKTYLAFADVRELTVKLVELSVGKTAKRGTLLPELGRRLIANFEAIAGPEGGPCTRTVQGFDITVESLEQWPRQCESFGHRGAALLAASRTSAFVNEGKVERAFGDFVLSSPSDMPTQRQYSGGKGKDMLNAIARRCQNRYSWYTDRWTQYQQAEKADVMADNVQAIFREEAERKAPQRLSAAELKSTQSLHEIVIAASHMAASQRTQTSLKASSATERRQMTIFWVEPWEHADATSRDFVLTADREFILYGNLLKDRDGNAIVIPMEKSQAKWHDCSTVYTFEQDFLEYLNVRTEAHSRGYREVDGGDAEQEVEDGDSSARRTATSKSADTRERAPARDPARVDLEARAHDPGREL
ncbi:hypothetical protein JL720_8682 [Aureococcus anophagefferens]|nr:hypothetical protein JL720_8682 [Aureococcus anophagefferens]